MCGGERAKSAAPLRGISSRVFQDLPKGVAEKSAGAIAAAATATAVMNDGMSGERCRSELAVHVTVVSELVFFCFFFSACASRCRESSKTFWSAASSQSENDIVTELEAVIIEWEPFVMQPDRERTDTHTHTHIHTRIALY